MAHSAKTKAKMRKAWKRRKLANKRKKSLASIISQLPEYQPASDNERIVMRVNEGKQWEGVFAKPDQKLGTQLRIRLPNDQTTETRVNGLIDRMTQAVDKIEAQIKRLESL